MISCAECIDDVPLHTSTVATSKRQEDGFRFDECSLASTCTSTRKMNCKTDHGAVGRTATKRYRERPTAARRPHSNSATSLLSARSWLFTVAFLAVACWPQAGLQLARAQEEDGGGSELCACTPSIYRFTLDFAAVCPPPGIEYGPETGIDQWFCRTDADDDAVTDLTPVSVTSYIVLELDKELQVIKQFFRGDLDLQDGDTFEYTSVTAGSGPVGPDDIPGAMQMALTGLNAQGDEVTSQWIVTFTNNCDVLPFEEGNSMSWATMSNLVPPRPDLCDASEGTPFPSPGPGSPTAAPTKTPLTLKPIAEPTAEPPVTSPTKAPVKEPTVLTLKPVSPPTKKPGDDDDDDDDSKPTKKPTPQMSMRMRELNWLDFANLGIEDLEGEDTFGETKKEQERQRLGLGGLDRRILKRRRRQSQQ